MEHHATEMGIALLPQELLDNILVYLPTEGKSRLSRCNKHLHARLQHALYASNETRDQALKWACEKGLINVISIAVSYGASVDTVSIATRRGTFKAFTLQIAASHRQVDTFCYLIREGARLDDAHVSRFGKTVLVRNLCRPGGSNTKMMRHFLEAGLASSLSKDLLTRLLMSVLESSSPESMQVSGIEPGAFLDSVRILLDAGANPNFVHYDVKLEIFSSPLSVALRSHRPDLFRFLIERGADVNGVTHPSHLNPYCLPLQVPACAAAFIMAEPGEDTSLLQLCLDCGANINIHVPYIRPQDNTLCFATPLLLFVENISDWGGTPGTPLEPGEKEHHNVVEKLDFFLLNGAWPLIQQRINWQVLGELQRFRESNGWSHGSLSCNEPDEPDIDESWSPFVFLLSRWANGSHASAHPNFLSALKLLIRRGALKANTGKIIARYDWFNINYFAKNQAISFVKLFQPNTTYWQKITRRIQVPNQSYFSFFWKEIINTVLEKEDYHQGVDDFLFDYIIEKNGASWQWDKPPSDGYPGDQHMDLGLDPTKQDSFRQTVAQLIAAGADINYQSTRRDCFPNLIMTGTGIPPI